VQKKVTAFTCSLGLSLALLLSSGSLHAAEKKPYWQCVTFARAYTGMQIYGDAWTWWDKAAGKYTTGQRPEPGAVLAFPSQGRMTRGHVAVVSRVITERVITITHANWSPIGGRRGQVEEDVTVVDVSDKGDWSRVKVWYDPLKDIGTTSYKTYGFIYNSKDATPGLGKDRLLVASNETLDGALSANAAQNAALADNRPASMKTSVMVRFPARPQTATATIGADVDAKKPVSIEAVLANRDDTATTSVKKVSSKTSLKSEMAPIADPSAKVPVSVTSPELVQKLTGKPAKAAVSKTKVAKAEVAETKTTKVSASKTKAVKAAAGKAKTIKASAQKASDVKKAAQKTSAKVKAGTLKSVKAQKSTTKAKAKAH
jgi:surface antigen